MTTPRVFLLPKDSPTSSSSSSSPSSPSASSSSASSFTVITLPHPRTSAPTRFLLHPTTGLHEITKITPAAATPRSWLFTKPKPKPAAEEGEEAAENKEEEEKEKGKEKEEKETPWVNNGQVLQDATLYVSTPADPLFILLPRLLLPAATAKGEKTHFLPLDDILDAFAAATGDGDDDDEADKPDWGALLRPGSYARRQVEARIRAVCDTVDVDGGKAYRPSEAKVAGVLVAKCGKMVEGGLPKSMEEAFVLKPLVRPISEEVPPEEEEEEKGEEGEGEKKEGQLPSPPVSQATTTQLTTADSHPSPTPAPPPPPAPLAILHLLRLRVASQYISTTYLPAHLTPLLTTALATAHDFAPLEARLGELKALRLEAASLRSGDFSLKRSFDEGGGDDAGAGKRRKREEEEAEKKRKKGVSKGVRELGKVNTRGMAKLTSFFTKKA